MLDPFKLAFTRFHRARSRAKTVVNNSLTRIDKEPHKVN